MPTDIVTVPPPRSWGVEVNESVLADLAQRWSDEPMPLPQFNYPGTPAERDESWWYDYVTVAVSVLACLWPPEGEKTWAVDHHGTWLDDSPGIFTVFTRLVESGQFDVQSLRAASAAELRSLFTDRSHGTLQLLDERAETIHAVTQEITDHWSGSVVNLVRQGGYDARRIAELLTESFDAYCDRPDSTAGTLPFDKLAHLAASVMAAGIGWERFTNFENFPVYPDYMLPRVFRHYGAMVYEPALAHAVDNRQLIKAGSPHEYAIRWATVYCGHILREGLHRIGNPVAAPGLDYFLWSTAVLGPDAASFGEHHRTLTMLY